MARFALTAGLAGTLLSGCDSERQDLLPSSSRPEASPKVSVSPAAPPIEDALALRDNLLRIAEENVTEEPGKGLVASFGIFEAWEAAYPKLSFSGYAIEPGPETVSTYSNLLNAKEPPDPDNPHVIAVAVLDTEGACAGGVLVGHPSPTSFEPVDLDPEHRCEPLTVAAAGGYETRG